MIVTIPNILSPQEVQQAQALLQNAPWEDGRVTAGVTSALVKNNQQLPFASAASQAIGEMVLQGLDRSSEFFAAALPHRVYTPRINRYAGGENYYGAHVDGSIRRVMPSGERVRTDVSCTVFLADPDSYDGGELVFHQGSITHSIKLAAGSAVVYPGDTVHEVRPVTRGARLAAFFWVQSLVRCQVQRRMLYDLDQSIAALRERDPAAPEVVSLTGHYHNLLRMWAQT
jgi:PKHD-type hydroxylase